MGVPELLIILGIVVVLFGATRLPALGRALGETLRSFKESSGENDGDAEDSTARLKEREVSQIEEATLEKVDDRSEDVRKGDL